MNNMIDSILLKDKIKKYYCDFVDCKIDGIMLLNSIIINERIKGTRKDNRVTLHEYYHLKTCPVNLAEAPKPIQNKYETLAERMTINKCMPIEKLLKLFEMGVRSLYELSEYLEIDEEYIIQGLNTYQQIYGYNYRYKEYLIKSFSPFVVELEA